MLLLDQTPETQKRLTRSPGIRWVLATLFILATTFTCVLPRENWPLLLLPYAVSFFIYVLILKYDSSGSLRFWLAVGIVARLILLFTFPNLSDDIYRFIWDGHLTLQGVNPYTVIPSEYQATGILAGEFGTTLLTTMNSPVYPTVYPPLLQACFAVSAWTGADNLMISSIMLKGSILIAELASIALLLKYFRSAGSPAKTLVYALNPLVIVELTGNIHFEAFMIFGLVLLITSLSSIQKSTLKNSAGMVAGLFVAIGSKLLPLIVVPFLFRRMRFPAFMKVVSVAFTLITLTLIPVLVSASGMAKSLSLYFQTFEFNASVYYILRWLGYLWKGYNMIEVIGMFTAGATVVALLSLLIFERKPTPENLPRILLFAFTAYFLFSNVVHPWYICTLVMLSAFTHYRYAIVWSALVFLSYATYRSEAYIENYWLVAIEYTIVITTMLSELTGLFPVHSRLSTR